MTATKRFFAYLELVRLPNVFTAIADVGMGFFVTHEVVRLPSFDLRNWIHLMLLATASACLYMGGMALNDAFDVEIDRAERPQRPIPSRRVSLAGARGLGFGLLAAGVFIGVVLAITEQDFRPALISCALGGTVLAYDAAIKRTLAGPIGMGMCRFLNVLLGMSLSPAPWETWNFVIAGGIGVYIVGVTWFARTEATSSNRLSLALATVAGATGILLLVWFPHFAPSERLVTSIERQLGRWYLVWTLLGCVIAWRCLWAIVAPRPELVQRAVRMCIFSLIMLDAVLTSAVAGFIPAILIMLLLLPTMCLGQFVYST